MKNIVLTSVVATSLLSGTGIATVSTLENLNKDVTLVVKGEETVVSTYSKNVEDLLNEHNVKFDNDDIINHSLDKKLEDGDKIEVIEVEKKVLKESRKVEFETKVVKDEEILEGESFVSTEGEHGENERVYDAVYYNGELVEKNFVEEVVLKEAVDEVLVCGTKEKEEVIEEKEETKETAVKEVEQKEVKKTVDEEKNTEKAKKEETKKEAVEEVKKEEVKETVVEEVKKEEVKETVVEEIKQEEVKETAVEETKQEEVKETAVEEVKKEEVKETVVEEIKQEEVKEETEAVESDRVHMVVNSSAYCTGTVTSTGTNPRWGVIAVDPNVIPYGSKVYIPQFNQVFVAEDTGSAIKGNKIDIFMNSKEEALNWGRQNIDIYVLK